MPALLLLILVSVHLGLWFHARNVATAAAQQGARSARAVGATDDDGRARADQMLDDLGATVLGDRSVSVTRDGATVTVTVTGTAPAVIPGLVLPVNASVSSPVEEFRAT